MATIEFFPFPEFGHLTPTLKLARMLKQAGHRIIYLGFAEFEEYVRSQGLEFIPILESSTPEGTSEERPAPMKMRNVSRSLSALEAADRASSGPFRQIEKELERILRETNPNLLIVDFLIGGLAYKAAREFGITSALVSVSYFEMPMLGEPANDIHHLELPVLVLCPKEFDLPHVTDKPNRYYIEASIDLHRKEPYPFPWEAVDASKPLIYSSVGCQPHLYDHISTLYRAIIDAMSERPDWQLVLAIGRHLDCSAFNPVPENVLLVNWAPQVELIKRATIMINHAGLGGVKECILFGVPMIVFPFKWDQPFNAARVVAHGLGVRGDIHNVSARQLHGLINTITGNASLKSRMGAMSKTFNEIENSGIGVRVVEKLLSGFRGEHFDRVAL
jgi:UDP:flavonoid glycosyltransferase YjiC (YdhE family)